MIDFYPAPGCGEYREGFEELLTERGYAVQGGIQVHMERTGERLLVVCENGHASIKAPQKVMLFRGLMHLVRRVELEGGETCFRMEEEIYLDRNGSMVDCSRNSVLNPDTVKQLLRIQAALGMNTMMLYTEDTYKVEEYPYFGAYRGRYSKEELKELDDYGDRLGIELIPCIQTLAHLQTVLRWPAMQRLRDTEDILLTGSMEAYDFIRACISSAAECFRSRRIHLGMDEAWSLGLGKYLHQNGYHSKAEIMTEHLERVMQICAEYDLEPMIWSDMYFRMVSPKNEYYDVPADSDLSGAVRPPEEVSLVYWDYYHRDKQFYLDYIRLHRQLSDKVIFAGGLWTWNGIAPNYTTAFENSREALRACKESGLRETFCTLWQDDGAETPILAGLPGLVMYGENGFTQQVSQERVKEQFEFLTGSSFEAYMLLDGFDHVEGRGGPSHIDNPSKYLLYQDALLGLFDGQIQGMSMNHHYRELRAALWEARKAFAKEKNRPLSGKKDGERTTTEVILDMYEALAELLSLKAELGLEIRAAYGKQDREALKRIAGEDIPKCITLTDSYGQLREEVWLKESRIFGFEVLDIRISGLRGRLQSAGKRIDAYVNGGLTSLPELEQEMPVFCPEKEGEERKLCSVNCWRHIVSASNL